VLFQRSTSNSNAVRGNSGSANYGSHLKNLPFAMLLAVLLLVFPQIAAADHERPCDPEPTDMLIGYDDRLLGDNCDIEPQGDVDFFRFEGTEGEVVRIQVNRRSGTGDPCFELRLLTGPPLLSNCGSFGGAAVAERALPELGTYQIRVYMRSATTTMSYAVFLQRQFPPLSPVSISPDVQLSGEISHPGEFDHYLFDGFVGSTARIQVNRVSGTGDPCFELRGPNYSVVGPGVCGSFGGPAVAERALPQTGPYQIRVYMRGPDTTMSYSVLLQCFGDECTGRQRPSISLRLSGCRDDCRVGDVFAARWSLNTAGSDGECKTGFALPNGSETSIGDSHRECTAGTVVDDEVLVSRPITPEDPPGTWQICGRLVGLRLGQILSASCQTFNILK
jgi:hypothetical protein